jgi:hypothetical protein
MGGVDRRVASEDGDDEEIKREQCEVDEEGHGESEHIKTTTKDSRQRHAKSGAKRYNKSNLKQNT